MLRTTVYTLFFLNFVLAMALFTVKEHVDNTRRELLRTHRQIVQTQQTLHTLKAEWAHLTEPTSVQQLVQAHLVLQRPEGNQFTTLSRVDAAPSVPRTASLGGWAKAN